MRQKHPNISVNLYEGEFMVAFECIGETSCRFALCEIMPPTGDDDCAFRENGDCRNQAGQQKALESLQTKIKKQLKEIGAEQ